MEEQGNDQRDDDFLWEKKKRNLELGLCFYESY